MRGKRSKSGACGIWLGPELVRRCECYSAATYKRSPARVSERPRLPDANSITANARKAICTRHGPKACRTRSTTPSRSMKATSIANCMKNVWILLQGARIRAWPSARPERPRRPRLRVGESNAVSMVLATMPAWRALRRTQRAFGSVSIGLRKEAATPNSIRRGLQDSLERWVTLLRSTFSNGRPTDLMRELSGPGDRNCR